MPKSETSQVPAEPVSGAAQVVSSGGRFRTVTWADGLVRLIDQPLLPSEEVWLDFADHVSLGNAIREMRVRGAPAIGATAAYGIALAAFELSTDDLAELERIVGAAAAELRTTRPTAINLFWAIDRMLGLLGSESTADALRVSLLKEAHRIADED